MKIDNSLERRVERLSNGSYLASTPAGDLRLEIVREEIPLTDALDFAARANPKRRFLFVSKLLGRHLPTTPSSLRDAAFRLSLKLVKAALRSPCVFVGMAETATTLGQAVFREWTRAGGEGIYIDTTRRRTGREVAFRFSEAHSHATEHFVHLPSKESAARKIFDAAETLVIVDDEVTTGRTAQNLIAAYEERRQCRLASHVAVLVRWENLSGSVPVQTHALLEGSFEFSPATNFEPPSIAPVKLLSTNPAPCGTRHGILRPQTCPWTESKIGHVLVLGTGEFGFVPFLLAEQIEAKGGHAVLQCTTRSPVVLGAAVQHVRSFPALSGEAYIEYLYNVPDDHPYDRIILCCEGHPPPARHPILLLPRIECRSMI